MAKDRGERVARRPHELHQLLAEQSMALIMSAANFDAGMTWEAKRLATTLRTLLHDGNWMSLLRQLGVREKLRYVSAAVADPAGGQRLSLIDVEVTPLPATPPAQRLRVRYKPRLVVQTTVDFATWWNAPVMTAGGESFSRWDLVRGPANQDGGAHVDARLKARYAALSRGALGGVRALSAVPTDFLVDENPVLPAVRTIAFELLSTFEERMLDLIPVEFIPPEMLNSRPKPAP